MSNEIPENKVVRRRKKPEKSEIIKQLNNSNLYPTRERIGIYIIAGLSVLGLVLIVYTGVMAAFHSGNGDNTSDGVLGLDDISEMVDELGLEEPDDIDDDELDGSDDFEEPEEPEETNGSVDIEPTNGRINQDNIIFRRHPDGTSDAIGQLHTDMEVPIISTDNPYWVEVHFNDLYGYVERDAIEFLFD